MKRFFILALAALLVISCSLTNGATMSAAQFMPASTETPASTPSPSPTPSPERCQVSAGLLNLRTCGGTHCGALAVLQQGDLLTVLERGHWLNVKTDTGAAGFINSKYCKKETIK
jgi:uncharacterized protein YgiM (DUF1202 family)